MTRDEFLTEKMGECWHTWHLHVYYNDITAPYKCMKCGQEEWVTEMPTEYPNFSTWEGFGKLWNWAKEQEWFLPFLTTHGIVIGDAPPFLELALRIIFINPDFFADAVAHYLGWGE